MGTATDNPSQFSHSAERAEACSDIVFYLSRPLHSFLETERKEEKKREGQRLARLLVRERKKDGKLSEQSQNGDSLEVKSRTTQAEEIKTRQLRILGSNVCIVPFINDSKMKMGGGS